MESFGETIRRCRTAKKLPLRKVVHELNEETSSLKVLQVAEEKIAYKTFRRTSKVAISRKIESVLKEFPAIEKAWLFGSFARKDDVPDSDIDILINVQNETEFTLFDISEIQEKPVSRERIEHILYSILNIQTFTKGYSLAEFENDLKVYYA